MKRWLAALLAGGVLAGVAQPVDAALKGLETLSQPASLNALTNSDTPQAEGGAATGGGKRADCAITVSGTSLTVNSGSCSFSAADVGSLIDVPQVGPNETTGSISSIAVSGAGSGYTAVPAVSLGGTLGSGTGFVGAVALGLDTVTLVNGGAGCTNSLQTFTLNLGVSTSTAQFTGTPSGGALTGTLTVSQTGSYTQIPVSPSTNMITVSGGGCTTAPTVTSTWHVAGITVLNPGALYPTSGVTASVASGSATLSNPTITTPAIDVLATTIGALISSSQITLGASATNSLSNTTVTLTWGPDQKTYVQNCINKASASNLLCNIPPGRYMVSGEINPAPSGLPAGIRGSDFYNTIIDAGFSGSQLLHRNSSFARGGSIKDIVFDGNRVVSQTAQLDCASWMTFEDVKFLNAKTLADLSIGNTAGCNTSTFIRTYLANGANNDDDALYFGGDIPEYDVYDNNTDMSFINTKGINATIAGMYLSSNSAVAHVTDSNFFKGGQSYAAMPEAYIDAAGNVLIDPYAGPIDYLGIDVQANNTEIVGGRTNAAYGIRIANGLTGVTVTNHNLLVGVTTALNRLIVDGSTTPMVGTLDVSSKLRNIPGLNPVSWTSPSSCTNSPTGVTGTTHTMQGLAVGTAMFVPAASGKMIFTIQGTNITGTAGDFAFAGLNWGLGGPPANGDTTHVGTNGASVETGNAQRTPFAITFTPTNPLIIGQPYWLDASAWNNTSAIAATLHDVCMTASELEN